MRPNQEDPRLSDSDVDQGPEILDEIEVEDLAVDGICGVY